MRRFWISLYYPVIMRVLCQAIVVPPKGFWQEFDIPGTVRRELFFESPDSRKWLRDMFADMRMLAHETGLMNPAARLVWRACQIDGRPSRYRSEPPRRHHTGVAAHSSGGVVKDQTEGIALAGANDRHPVADRGD